MSNFFKENSYNMVKLFLNQIALTVFGTMLALSTVKNPTLLLVTSIFSVLFYLYLVYSCGWEIGAKDKIRIDGGRIAPAPAKGFLIALIANVPNLLLAILMGIGAIISTSTGAKWAGDMSVVCNAIARLIEGMYLGIIKILEDRVFADAHIIDVWWWFIVITFPAIITGGISYLLGSKNFRILSLFGITYKPSGKGMHGKR
jgi:hypothetical protein